MTEVARDVLAGGTRPEALAGPLTQGRSNWRWVSKWWWSEALLLCTRELSPASSWFMGINHSCLGPFFNPLLPGGLCDEVNLSSAYLELMLAEGKNANYLYLKID